MFHILWISVLRCLYFNFFSASFCITFLSDGTIATSINKQVLSFLVLIIMSGLFAKTSYYYYYYKEHKDMETGSDSVLKWRGKEASTNMKEF
jgi:hypothetical protein